jgi:hypothetical protein
MSPGKAARKGDGNPEGRATWTAPGGTGQAACAGMTVVAIANTADMTQIHFLASSFTRS